MALKLVKPKRQEKNSKRRKGNNSFLTRLPYIVGGAALVYATSTLISLSDWNIVEDNSWQACSIFVAPSKLPNGGWGVFAAKSFEKN